MLTAAMTRNLPLAGRASIACSAKGLLLFRQTGVLMPIRPEMREFYPSNWPQISRRVRFDRAAGICQECNRRHGMTVRCLPDGRWFDPVQNTWRNGRGRPARWPDLVETAQIRHTRVVLAAAHLDHNPRNNRRRNLKSLCQRCHMIHDRPHHLAQRRITYLIACSAKGLLLFRQTAVSMPIKPEMRGFYPSDWPQISRRVQFRTGRRDLPGLWPAARDENPMSARRPLV